MRTTYLPATDAALLIWGANFADQVACRAGHYGAAEAQVADLVAANGAYAEAVARAGDPATRTRGAVAARNDARGALKAVVRRVVSVVRGQAGVTAEELVNIGLPAHPRRPVALPAPQDAPGLAVVSASGHAVRLRLRDRSGERYGRPRGAAGAVVFSHVGPTPPPGRPGGGGVDVRGDAGGAVAGGAVRPRRAGRVDGLVHRPLGQPPPAARPAGNARRHQPPRHPRAGGVRAGGAYAAVAVRGQGFSVPGAVRLRPLIRIKPFHEGINHAEGVW